MPIIFQDMSAFLQAKITVKTTSLKGAESQEHPGHKENKLAKRPLPIHGGLHRQSCDQKAKTKRQRSPDHMVERDNKGKTTQVSVIIKLPSSPDNTQMGPGTKQNLATSFFFPKTRVNAACCLT